MSPIDDKDKFDDVEKPAHYNLSEIECFDAIEAQLGKYTKYYCLGNVVKYDWRHEYKGTPLKDLKKAAWYLNKAIEMHEKYWE